MSKKDILKSSKKLLDRPINLTRKRLVRNNKLALAPLPEPLKPTPYQAPQPVPKKRSKAPVPLPRNQRLTLEPRVKKLIDEIRPYYTPEAIRKFKKDLKFIKRAEITEKNKALKGNVANYVFSIANDSDPSIQLANTREILKEKLISLINEKRKGLKFGITQKIKMRKETEDGVIYREPYFNSKAKTITHPEMINDLIREAEEEILNNISDWISEGSQWLIELILEHYLNIINYQPLRGGSYLELPKELRNAKKGLINPKNLDDNECFRWCHIRHLNPQKKILRESSLQIKNLLKN